MSRASWPGLRPTWPAGRVVVAHLGNGASMCAIHDGRSVASTMGFSALDGLPMGTRCGQLDPGVLLYLMEQERHERRRRSRPSLQATPGLLGLSGLSNDMRMLEAADTRRGAPQAIDYFVFRVQREIGALAAAMGGIDALGLLRRHWREQPRRSARRICERLGWMGIEIDHGRNAARRGDHLVGVGAHDGHGRADQRGTGDRPRGARGGRHRGKDGGMKGALKPEAAAALIPDGAVVMIGGFMGVGSPHRLIDALVAAGHQGPDGDRQRHGHARHAASASWCLPVRCRRLIVSHIGLNPETQAKMISGEIEVELVPQGTLVERIRAGGVGLGGVLTRTGLGTEVEEGKQVDRDRRHTLPARNADPRADFALIGGAAGRLCRQPRLLADRAQLQSDHGAGRRTP